MRVPMPLLQIVPQADVILHEEYDEGRVARLADRLQADGVLKDPPIAGRLPDLKQLIELDGTNRLMALRHMGLDCALVQVVDYLDPAMQLSAWYHVVHQLPFTNLLSRAQAIPGLEIEQTTRTEADNLLASRHIAAYLTASNAPQTAHVLHASDALATQARVLNELVHAYKFKGGPPVHRISSDEIYGWPTPPTAAPSHGASAGADQLDRGTLISPPLDGKADEGDDGTLIAFPTYTPHEVAQMALSGDLLPSGVTRHLLPVRALDVHLPLDLLRANLSLAEKNRQLQAILHERSRGGRTRLYYEPTFIYNG